MDEERKNKINEALKGLSQQEAYDLICEYMKRIEWIYPTIKKVGEKERAKRNKEKIIDALENKEGWYIPLLAFDTEEQARIILRHLAFTSTGRIAKITEKEYKKLDEKAVDY